MTTDRVDRRRGAASWQTAVSCLFWVAARRLGNGHRRRRRRPVLSSGLVAALAALLLGTLAQAVSVPAAAAADATATPPALPKPLPVPGQPIVAAGTSGYLPDSWQVTPDGAFSYRLPLDVPAGRAGLQPRLTLGYSSQGGDGPFGLGWALSGLSSVTRCGQSLTTEGQVVQVTYTRSDRFCLDGQKLVGVGDSSIAYGTDGKEYRTETDSFAKVISLGGTLDGGPNEFRVAGKDGRLRYYSAYLATRTGSAVALPSLAEGQKVTTVEKQAWLLDHEVDRSGNEVRYEYTTDDTHRPYRIWYTAGPGRQAQRYVQFNYSPRASAASGSTTPEAYAVGVPRGLTTVISSIEMYAPNPSATGLVWRYAFTYKTGATGRVLLASVVRCGPTGSTCNRAKTFDWYQPAAVPTFSAVTLATRNLNLSGTTLPMLQVADVDGDGADDAIYTLGGDANASMFLARGSRDARGAVSPLADVHLLNLSGDWPAGTDLAASRPMDLQADGTAEFTAHWRQTNGVEHDTVLRWDQAAGAFKTTGATFVGTSTNFADMDGDGRMDYLTADVPDGSFKDYSVRLNTSGGSSLFGTAQASPFTSGCLVRVTDTKGDGRAELVGPQKTVAGTCSATLYALRKNGPNLNTYSMSYQDSSGTVYYRALPVGVGGTWSALGGDFNGDGLGDTLLVPTNSTTATARLLWNTGNGLRLDWHAVTVPRDGYRDIRITDVNGDGRDDLVTFHAATTVLVSKGDGTFTSADIAGSGGTAASNGRATSQVADFTGDGRADVLRVVNGQLVLLVQQPAYPDRLATVADAGTTWPRISVHYSNAWTEHPEKMSDYTCSYPQACPRRGRTVVRQVGTGTHLVNATSDAASLHYTYYSYEDPVTDLRGRGFLGFGTFRTWDPSRPSETVVTFSLRQLVDGRYYPGVGRPATVTSAVPLLTRSQANGKPTTATARIQRSYFTDETRKLNGGATYAVFDKSSYSKEWEEPVTIAWGSLGGATGAAATTHVSDISEPATPLRRVDQSSSYDDYGNRTRHVRSTVGGVYDQVDTQYDNRVADWLITLPVGVKHTRIEPGCNASCERTDRYAEYHYDALGRLDVVSVEPNDPDPGIGTTTRYGYDGLGVARTVTVSAANRPDRVTHTEYAPVVAGWADEEIYPSQVWSEHDQAAYRPSTWTAVYPGYGVTVATEDANGTTASAVFDQQGRPTLTRHDGQADTTISYANRPDLDGYNGTVTTSTQAGVTTTTSTDARGLVIESTVTGFDGTKASTTSLYDDLGRLVTTTAPAPGGTTGYQYDSLDRRVVTTLPDGKTTTASYTFSTTHTVDALGNKRDVTHDVDDRATTTVDVNKNPDGSVRNITTQYQYAPYDLVDRVTDDQGHVTTMAYDKRGRRTQLTEPDRGTTTTTYFGTGEVRTDSHQASGHTTTFGYDDLGRKTSETTEDGASTFTWDTAAHGIGALASSLSPDAVRTDHRYDSAGRLAGTDYTMVGSTFTAQTDQTYDTAGRLATVVYPDAPGRTRAGGNPFTVAYGYNSKGYLATLTDVAPDHSTPLWTVASRKPNLALDTATLGSGAGAITVKRSYDSPTGRLHNLAATTAGGATLQNLTYGYDGNGQVITRLQNDAGTDGTDRYEEFGYDALGRLTAWNLYTGGEADTTYTYDTIGNLTGIDRTSDAGGSTGPASETRGYGNPDGSQPHALTAVTPTCPSGQACVGEVMTYDSQGRQKTGGGRTTTYTAFDLPKTVTKGGVTTFFDYDAAGQRIFESTGNTFTFSVPGLFERRQANGATTYVYYVSSPDGPVAQVVYDGTKADTEYQLADALGSVTGLADGTGKLTRSFFYEPFGGRIDADGTPLAGGAGDTTHGFTGHEHDDDLGLINMKGRVYDPDQKRFLSPDPVVAEPGTSQSWNPYSYVKNSPLNYTDPTGYIYCDASCRWLDAQTGADLQAFFNAAQAYSEGGIAGLAGADRDHFIHDGDAARHQAADKEIAAEEASKNKQPAKSDSDGSTQAKPGDDDVDGVPEIVECDSGCLDEDGTPEAVDTPAVQTTCGDWTSTGGGTGLYTQLCSHHIEDVSWFTLHWFNYGSEVTIGDVTVYGTTNDSQVDYRDPELVPTDGYGPVGITFTAKEPEHVMSLRASDCGGVTVGAGESGWCAGGYGERDFYSDYPLTGFGGVYDGYKAEVEVLISGSPAGHGWADDHPWDHFNYRGDLSEAIRQDHSPDSR